MAVLHESDTQFAQARMSTAYGPHDRCPRLVALCILQEGVDAVYVLVAIVHSHVEVLQSSIVERATHVKVYDLLEILEFDFCK